MSRPLSQKIYQEVFARWPTQVLRPEFQLQDVMGKAVAARYTAYTPAMEQEELLKARALQQLLQDKHMNTYKLTGAILEPKSQPTYFADLIQEIDEAPNRSWFGRMKKRIAGMVRFQ